MTISTFSRGHLKINKNEVIAMVLLALETLLFLEGKMKNNGPTDDGTLFGTISARCWGVFQNC